MKEAIVNPTQIEVVEVYVYHDRPLLFCGENALGHKYLAVLVEEEDDNETWLYVGMSYRRFEMVRSGGIDLATAFAKPEDEEAIVVTVPFENGLVSWKTITADEIPEDWLPVSGEQLNIVTETIKDPIEKRASQAYREAVTLKLNFRKYTRSEAPVLGLGEILIRFQDALSSMVEASNSDDLLLKVVGFNPGSFEVELEAQKQADMFQYSLAGEALNELVTLVNNSENSELLVARLKQLPPDATAKFGKFMKTISQQTRSAEIIWGSPRKDYGGNSNLTSEQANRVWQTIEETDQPKVRTFEVVGTLRGLDLDTRHFRIVDQNGKAYWGYIDKDSIEDQVIQNARIRRIYTATIKETYTPPAIGKDAKLKYEMLSLIQK